jgi:hypothetical protein
MHKNSLIVQAGRCVAAKVAGRIEFFAEVDPAEQLLMRKSLQVGRRIERVPDPPVEDSEPHILRRPVRSTLSDESVLHSRRRLGM